MDCLRSLLTLRISVGAAGGSHKRGRRSVTRGSALAVVESYVWDSFIQTSGISNPTGDLERTIEALVDTGSLYTTVPTSLLEEIGTERLRQVRFELADGSVMETDIGVAVVAIDGHEVATSCRFWRGRS